MPIFSPTALIRAISNPSGSPLSPTYSKGGNAAFVPTTSVPFVLLVSALAALPQPASDATVKRDASTTDIIFFFIIAS